jgi:hypothetical protein
MTDKLLKLLAKDSEDIQVVSAILQDAIAPVCDMMYNAADKNFIMVVHRLRREIDSDQASVGSCGLDRICCAVNIRGVAKAQMQGIDLGSRAQILELLAVMKEELELVFLFAAGAKIRLQQEKGSMIVEDFGDPWPAQCAPCHENNDK